MKTGDLVQYSEFYKCWLLVEWPRGSDGWVSERKCGLIMSTTANRARVKWFTTTMDEVNHSTEDLEVISESR